MIDKLSLESIDMDESFALSVTGRSSVLDVQYFPPIELSPHKPYALGLVELLTFNSIPNVDVSNNKFYIGDQVFIIPTGSYEIEDIASCVQKLATPHNMEINIKANNNTLRSEIKCNFDIDFSHSDSIGRLLGFTQRILKSNVLHVSDLPVAILNVNALRVECSITTGSYLNGNKDHTIHEFFPTVPPGYKIVEVPAHVIYLPVTVKTIDHIQLRIVDQAGLLVNFRGEEITIRLHIKSVQ